MTSMQHRQEQPYVAIASEVTMTTVGAIATVIPALMAWLEQAGVTPAGPLFFRYTVIDMDGKLKIEAGVPVASPVEASDPVIAGTLPGGCYAVAQHHGHPDGLKDATAALLASVAELGMRFDVTDSDEGEVWGGRLEWYLTDPNEQPDMTQWDTELAFKLSD
jgi:effector-binding domain-containing protein